MASASPESRWDQLRLHWLVVGLAILFAAIYVQYALKMQHSEHGMRSAFLRWKTQLEDLDDGVNVWDKYAYPNPPIMALILKPFVQLPPTLGSSLWFACKAMLALASILIVLSLLDSPDRPFPMWGKAIAIVLCLRPIEGDLVHGNINLYILFLVVASLHAFCQRRDALAGLLLGLSVACKLTPALFLLYFLWKRAWTALLGSCVGLIAFGLLIPGVAYGWSNNLDYLQSWHRQMIAPYAAGVVSSEHKNQSLPGLLHRMLSESPSFSDFEGDQKVVLETHNLASLDPEVVQGIILGCMAIFAILAMRFCRTPIEQRPRMQLLAEFSVVVLGMLLFCERTWKHHCVTLLLPFSVMAYAICTPVFSRDVRWQLGITLAIVALLMLATSTGIYDQRVRQTGAGLRRLHRGVSAADGEHVRNPAAIAAGHRRRNHFLIRTPHRLECSTYQGANMANESTTWPVLTMAERRVLGVMVEKAKTTPDVYPMSLNSMMTGANQKSNRDPLMNLSEDDVETTLQGLQPKGYVTRIQGGRVERWRHNLYDQWSVNKVELAILTELLLRGPQTEGELRQRASRMEPIDDLDALRDALKPLTERRLVLFLGSEGRRGTLITHGFHAPKEIELLKSQTRVEEVTAAAPVTSTIWASAEQVAKLEQEIAALRAQMQQVHETLQYTKQQLQTLKDSLGG